MKVEEYLNKGSADNQVKLLIADKLIYVGKIIGFEISNMSHLTYLNLKVISYSYDLDVKRNRRAFIDLNYRYKDIFHSVLRRYNNYDFADYITENQYLPQLLVQYEETDLGFFKRIMSHFNSVLVVDSTSDCIRLNFGIQDIVSKSKLQNQFNEVKADFKLLNTMKNIKEHEPFESDFLEWKLEYDGYIPLCTVFWYCNNKVCVYKLQIEMLRGELKYTYYLKPLKGIVTQHAINPKLKGVSLDGVIKKEKNNKMQIHFCINDEYHESENNMWLDYCREVNDFYVMPVIGSKVHITFLTGDEKDVCVTDSIRSAGNTAKYYGKISNPNNKSYSTEYGQELLMSPENIQISEDEGKSIQISLSKDGSVSITGKNISLKSDSEMKIGSKAPFDPKRNIKPKSISISAKNAVTITRSSDKSINVSESIQLKEESHIRGVVKLGR